MKRGFFITFILMFFMAGSAFAGPSDLTGTWSGTVYSKVCCGEGDCYTLEIHVDAIIVQEGSGLFTGTFEAEDYEHPCWGAIEGQSAILTGNISVNKNVSGVIGVPVDGLGYVQGTGIFQGSWRGNKMEAVLLDLSDGSTTIGTLIKH